MVSPSITPTTLAFIPCVFGILSAPIILPVIGIWAGVSVAIIISLGNGELVAIGFKASFVSSGAAVRVLFIFVIAVFSSGVTCADSRVGAANRNTKLHKQQNNKMLLQPKIIFPIIL